MLRYINVVGLSMQHARRKSWQKERPNAHGPACALGGVVAMREVLGFGHVSMNVATLFK
jgi:hypothetical protein